MKSVLSISEKTDNGAVMDASGVITNLSPSFGRLEAVAERLAKGNWTLDTLCDTDEASDPEARRRVADALSAGAGEIEYLCVRLFPVGEAFIEKADKLKIIVKNGVGVDNIDVRAATRRKIPVANAAGANADATAELAVGFIFALARNICGSHADILAGNWRRFLGSEVAGKKLGIVGLGAIGRALALKAKALGMEVLANTPRPPAEFCREHGIRPLDLPGLLREADYVSLHVVGGAKNTGLIGERELGMMRPGAFLLNLSRGEVLDADALARALEQGRLAGAALDVFPKEPPSPEHPLFRRKNVIFSPHVGGETKEALIRVGLMNIEDLEAARLGKRPPRVLNPQIYE
jgi:D-3-phosphoglycerate dehydrogenase